MGAAGIERHHDLGAGIGGIDLGDLHADRRIARAGAFALELGDLLAVGEHGNDRDGARLFAGAFLPVAEHSLERAKRDLPARGLGFLLPASSLDIWRRRLDVEVLELEVFGISLLDRLGKAWRGLCPNRQQRSCDDWQKEAAEWPESGHFKTSLEAIVARPAGRSSRIV